MGEAWHDDGMLMKKMNTFTDFIDAAEFLIKDKWTSTDRLVIEGGSAGGLLMGTVTNLRPDLFKAVHAAVPFVDVMNTELDASLPGTTEEWLEWGNPNEKAAFDYMRAYSPYDNLAKKAYPAILVTSSFNDSQVGYWEPAKYVAKLRTPQDRQESAAPEDEDGTRRPWWRFGPLRPPEGRGLRVRLDAAPGGHRQVVMTAPLMSRRRFLASSVAGVFVTRVSGPSAAAAATERPMLGLDNFAVRGMNWKAAQLIDYAASIDADSLFITDLDAFESFDAPYLAGVKAHAREKAVQIHVGTWSICPTSKAFKPKWGNAEEHLTLAIRVAQGVGSPVIRAVLGTWEDRLTDGGIERHMEETAKVCRACRSRAIDADVKIAIENHAGDMHSSEVVRLIEAAGRDYVGVNLDSGNALWTLEDPLASWKSSVR